MRLIHFDKEKDMQTLLQDLRYGARLRDINGAVELHLADSLDATLEIRELDQRPQVEPSRVAHRRVGEKSYHGQIGAGEVEYQ
jgi:hypothetical protein